MSVKELISKFEIINTTNTASFTNDNTIKTHKPYYPNGKVGVESLISFWEEKASNIKNPVEINISKKNNKAFNRVLKKILKIDFTCNKDKSFVSVGTKKSEEAKKGNKTALGADNKNIEVVVKRERLRSRMATVINWPSKS